MAAGLGLEGMLAFYYGLQTGWVTMGCLQVSRFLSSVHHMQHLPTQVHGAEQMLPTYSSLNLCVFFSGEQSGSYS